MPYGPFQHGWPYSNFHDLNLDWVISVIRELETKITQFVALNTVKYANPFQWDITRQYETNTVVIDPSDGTAYLSVQPVPSGVQITNTDYWTPVADISGIYTQLVNAITSVQYPDFGYPAAENIEAGKLVWIKNCLYICTQQVIKGQNITEPAFTITDLDTEFTKLVEKYAEMIRDTTQDLNARISNIIANGQQTEGNTELIDIRSGYDGVNYPTAGDAVRGQVKTLDDDKVGSYITVTSSAQLASLDDALPNKIYLIGVKAGAIANLPDPKASYGTLITLNHKADINDGTVQLYATKNKNIFYMRSAWENVYGEWFQINFPVGKVSQIENALNTLKNDTLLDISKWNSVGVSPDEPYNNIDTFPIGSIVSGELTNVIGKLFNNGQIITLGQKAENYGKGAVQFAISNYGDFYYRVNWGTWKSWTKVNVDVSQYVTKDEIVQKSSISMFENIGVVGDSYASGGMVIQGKIVVNYNISWPQVLKRYSGSDFVNYSFAGATCKTWLTNSTYGLPKLKQDANKQMYCICLGINDADRQNTEPTGTIADIKDNYSENPDTFFGNMGRIISEIQEKSPKSKILIFTIPKKQAQYVEYSGYIKQIADKFNLPCIDSMSDYFLSSSDFQDTMSGGHPLAVGYSGMANSMRKLIEKEMTSAYFNDYTGKW